MWTLIIILIATFLRQVIVLGQGTSSPVTKLKTKGTLHLSTLDPIPTAVVTHTTKAQSVFIPATPTCSNGQTPLLVLSMGKKGFGTGQLYNNVPLQRCSILCKGETDLPTTCAGFDYQADLKMCTIYSNVNTSRLLDVVGTDFYQKVCVENTNVCGSPMEFEMVSQMVLVGFARQVITSSTPANCMKQCLNAYSSFGFECQSAMFYPGDQSCILNTENRYKRPDLFTAENNEQVLYFDNNCAGATCGSSHIVQYIKTADIMPINLNSISIAGSNLFACQSLCTDNIGSAGGSGFNCKSFNFNNGDQTCVLYDDRIVPFGRANVNSSPGVDYYEKGCYKGQETCRNMPAFTRVPQKVLVGYAAYVVDGVASVFQCLDTCLKPPQRVLTDNPNFKCVSVMYYYNEQECILNTETQHTKPDFMVTETLKEDYFDIMCLQGSETCPSGTVLSTIKIGGVKVVPNNKTSILNQFTGSIEECINKCYQLSPQKCRSFNYNSGQCELLTVTPNTEKMTKFAGNDYYGLICLPGEQPSKCSGATFELYRGKALKSSGGTFKDKTTATGTGSATALFEKRKRIKRQAVGKILGDQSPISLPECLATCQQQSCAGLNYNNQNGLCQLFSSVGSPTDDPHFNTDFYVNSCSSSVDAGITVTCNFDGMKVTVVRDQPFTGAVFAKMKYDSCRAEVLDASMTVLNLGFPIEKIRIKQTSSSLETTTESLPSSTRARFARRQKRDTKVFDAPYESSVSNGQYNVDSSTSSYKSSSLPKQSSTKRPQVFQPPSFPTKDCGLIDLKNGSFKATVVVQANNLGIPGLVTSMDSIYEVSCDYSNFLNKKVNAISNMHVEGPVPALIKPRGKIDLSNPVVMRLTSDEGDNILHAKLGDPLQLRFEMMMFDTEMDFFVDECFAERSGPLPPGTHDLKSSTTSSSSSYGNGSKKKRSKRQGGYGVATSSQSNFDEVPHKDCSDPGCKLIGGPKKLAQNFNQLKLIEQGCPTRAVSGKIVTRSVTTMDNRTKIIPMRAFRFDGTQTVRLICQLTVCKKTCQPTSCLIDGSSQESWGKRKREIDPTAMNDVERHKLKNASTDSSYYETQQYIVSKYSTAITSFLVVDDDDEQVATPGIALAQNGVRDVITVDKSSIGVDVSSLQQDVCLPTLTFLFTLTFFTILIAAQVIGLAICLAFRFTKRPKNIS